jgi:hypothetical protein
MRDFLALVVQDPESVGQRLMGPLDNDIRKKRLCMRNHLRHTGQVGSHSIEDFGFGSLATCANEFDLKHRLTACYCPASAFSAGHGKVNRR